MQHFSNWDFQFSFDKKHYMRNNLCGFSVIWPEIYSNSSFKPENTVNWAEGKTECLMPGSCPMFTSPLLIYKWDLNCEMKRWPLPIISVRYQCSMLILQQLNVLEIVHGHLVFDDVIICPMFMFQYNFLYHRLHRYCIEGDATAITL